MQILTSQTKIESIPDQLFSADTTIKNHLDDTKIGSLLSSICYVDPQRFGAVYFPANYDVRMNLSKLDGKVSIIISNHEDVGSSSLVRISYSSFDPVFCVELCQHNKAKNTDDVEVTMAFNFDYVEARNEEGINKVSKAINSYLQYELVETDFSVYKN